MRTKLGKDINGIEAPENPLKIDMSDPNEPSTKPVDKGLIGRLNSRAASVVALLGTIALLFSQIPKIKEAGVAAYCAVVETCEGPKPKSEKANDPGSKEAPSLKPQQRDNFPGTAETSPKPLAPVPSLERRASKPVIQPPSEVKPAFEISDEMRACKLPYRIFLKTSSGFVEVSNFNEIKPGYIATVVYRSLKEEEDVKIYLESAAGPDRIYASSQSSSRWTSDRWQNGEKFDCYLNDMRGRRQISNFAYYAEFVIPSGLQRATYFLTVHTSELSNVSEVYIR